MNISGDFRMDGGQQGGGVNYCTKMWVLIRVVLQIEAIVIAVQNVFSVAKIK